MKIAVSWGEAYFSPIGDENEAYYILVGDPVWETKDLQHKINAGEILVGPSTWVHVRESLYNYFDNKELNCIKVFGFRDALEVAQRQQEKILSYEEIQERMLENENLEATAIIAKEPYLRKLN